MPLLTEIQPGQLWRMGDEFIEGMSKDKDAKKLGLTHLYILVVDIGEDDKGPWWDVHMSVGSEFEGDRHAESGMQKMYQKEIEEMLPGFVLISEAP